MCSQSTFPAFEGTYSLFCRGPWGIRRTCDGIPCLAVKSETINRLVRPRRLAGQVRQLLAAGKHALPGKDDRYVRQIKVEGFGARTAVVVGAGATPCRSTH